MADFLLAALRGIHVLGTVFWAGGTFLLAGYHEYVVDPGEPERTLERLAAYDDMSTMVGASGIVGVLAGLVLYWFVSGGLAMSWITSPYGLSITVGAVAALAAIAVAFPMVAMPNERSKELYETFQESGELTAEQAETVDRLYERIQSGERWMSVLLAIAVLAMASAQYL